MTHIYSLHPFCSLCDYFIRCAVGEKKEVFIEIQKQLTKVSTLFFSLNKNKIRINKTREQKIFSQKRDILSKKVSKAKILARIVLFFFFFFLYKYNYPDNSSALKRGFTKRTVSLQFYLISCKKNMINQTLTNQPGLHSSSLFCPRLESNPVI